MAPITKSVRARTHLLREAIICLAMSHPSLRRLHSTGTCLRLCSQEGGQKLEDLVDATKVEPLELWSGVRLPGYEKSLFGANSVSVVRTQGRFDPTVDPRTRLGRGGIAALPKPGRDT